MLEIVEHNCETGQVIQRPMTIKELEAWEQKESVAEAEKAEAQAKETARQAVLDRLGLTQDEVRLILG